MNEEQKRAGVACVRAQIAAIQADRVRASREDRESKDAYLAACDDLHAARDALIAATPYPEGVEPRSAASYRGKPWGAR